MKIIIKINLILFIGILLSSASGFSQESDIYKLQFVNGSKQKAIKIIINKDNIYFYDLFNLEHLVNKSKIKLITKIRNQNNSLDLITLSNNSTIEGIILEINPIKNYLLLSRSKDTISIDLNELQSISKHFYAENKFRKSKYELGANLGFPSAVNLTGAIWFDDFGLRLSGLYIGIAQGIQLNFCYKLSENKKRYHSLAFVLGNSDIQKDKFGRIYLKNFHWQYAGMVYDANIGDFWVEFGLSYGYGDYHNPQIIFQIGYSAKFF